MEKLTFREVIANIKEGEVWESLNKASHIQKIISKKWGINFIFNCDNEGDLGEIGVNNNCRFKLKRKQYSFQEAFKAYEEGKQIESCESGLEYRIKEGIVEISANKTYEDTCGLGESIFSTKEIKGKWYINS